MSNREIKLKLYSENPCCHWCGRLTNLTNIPEIRGQPDKLMATVDHLISRYHPQRWVKKSETKVLACHECNSNRAKKETLSLTKEEMTRRSQGFSLNPRGKPIFIDSLDSLDDVLDKLQSHGIIFSNDYRRRNSTTFESIGISGDSEASKN